MTTTGLSSLPTALANLLHQYSGASSSSSASAAAPSGQPVPAGAALGSDPAFTLALSQEAMAAAMVGYDALGKMGEQFETDMAKAEGAGHDGGSVKVVVHQLAEAQSVVAGPFGDPDDVSLGTGVLSLEGGQVDPAGGGFVADGDPVTIPIANGSLNDIAASINAADLGLQAEVVEEGGGFALHLTGPTGAAKAFRLSGLPELAFDPAKPDQSFLSVAGTARDALYSVDGEEFAFDSNTDVPVALGARATFTAPGELSVATSTLGSQVQTLVRAFNAMQQGITGMAGKDGKLEKDVNLAAGLFKSLGDAATGTFQTGGAYAQLSEIGVTVQPDGTLGIDAAALDQAMAADPAALQRLVDLVSTAMTEAAKPYTEAGGSLHDQVALLGKMMMRGAPSLLDYMNGNGSAQAGGLASYLGGGQPSGAQGGLVSYLDGGGSSTASGLASVFSAQA